MFSSMMFYLILTMFILGNMIFISKYKHLLIMLMSLEFMVLSLFMFLSLLISLMYFNMSLLMIYLVFSVCEGALGLSILISMIRTHGNDYFNSFNVLF